MRRGLRTLLLPLAWLLPLPAAIAEYAEIGNAELRRLLASETLIVDVRRVDEWRQTGVIANSHRMTFFDRHGNYDAAAWLARLAEIGSPETPLILICETGGRSRVIGRWLNHRLGFDRVYNVRDGIAGWLAAGQPVVPVPE